MAYAHYERLSALDLSFLELEDRNTHMHIGAVAIFEGGSLATAAGGVDIEHIRRAMQAGLHRVPRYRQRLAYIPLVDHPVWVDDTSFNLHYHLRHTHLPVPGDDRALKRLTGRLMSQQLDRGKPLWEMWIVEGIEGGRFAIVTKIHHCMIDGVGSAELTASIMRPTPDLDPRLEGAAPVWVPRPAPGARELLLGEVARRAREPLSAVAGVPRALANPASTARGLAERVQGVWEALSAGLTPASPTPLNVEIGPHRRFDWTVMELAAVKAVKEALGGTVNDVVLATMSGALRRFLRQRGLAVEELDFRAMLPVNVRPEGDRAPGNRVAMMVARLPLEEHDPRTRLARVVAETQGLKRSHQATGVRTIEELGDATLSALFVQFARLAARSRPFNLVVTNVPGPPFPVYALGARMLACYPLVPLYENQALGVALFSYDGRLHWGFNADWDAVPDLHDLVDAVDAEFAALCRAAEGAGAALGTAS